MEPCFSSTVSPGRPISRFTKVPPSPHFWAAFGGVRKTMMSPRDGLEKSRQMRQARTRSEKCARQPGPGAAQWSVGSIDDEGMRYGLTTHSLSARTMRIAPMIVTAQSIAIRHGRGRLRVSRSTGFQERCGCDFPYRGTAPRWIASSYAARRAGYRSGGHTSEIQSHSDLVCRPLLEKKKHAP